MDRATIIESVLGDALDELADAILEAAQAAAVTGKKTRAILTVKCDPISERHVIFDSTVDTRLPKAPAEGYTTALYVHEGTLHGEDPLQPSLLEAAEEIAERMAVAHG